MFFTVLLSLWLVFLGLVFAEGKLIKSEKSPALTQKYLPIRGGIILLSVLFAVIYTWNLTGNVNIQNIVMTVLMGVTVVLSVFVTPKMVTTTGAKGLKGWLIFRNVIAVFNGITMLVHFIIFVLLA